MTKDKNIKKACELIDKNAFKEAEEYLLELRRKKSTPVINYLLGYIHHVNLTSNLFDEDKDHFQGSKTEAERYLGSAIDSEKPIEDAFWRLADIEDNKKHSVRILKKGLEHFPNSEIIYEYLIKKSEDSDIPKIYDEIEYKNIVSNTIYFQLYEFFGRKKKYDTAFDLINKIKLSKKDEKQLLSLIKAFCLYELLEIEKAKIIFQKLIDDDINQKLYYAQYIGLLLCLSESKEIDKAVKLINELPNQFNEPFVSIRWDLRFYFENYFEDLISKLIIVLKTQKEYKVAYAKIRGIKALKICEFEGVNKKTITDLKFARNNLKDKKVFDTALVSAYSQANQIIKAFEQDFQNIVEYSEYGSELEWILEEASKKESKIIANSFIQKLKSISSWEKAKFQDTVKVVIEALHENKDYESVIKVSNYFSEDVLGKADVLFEVAFSYSKNDDGVNAKKFYEKIWKKEQTSSAVANNLALLYENEDDWIQAKELFKKALELDPADDIAQNNLERVTKKIKDEIKDIKKSKKEQVQILKDIKMENLYIHERLSFLIENEDEEKNIVASYSQLCGILKARPEKAQELIKSFLLKNYIIKIEHHNIETYSNVYRVSYLVRSYILEQRERIEANKPLSNIGEKINLNSFENLGFDKNLLSTVDTKISDKNLRDILKRDLKENVFALLTESYKTALVLGGSIIESFILNKILDSDITKHLPNSRAARSKKVLDMNLSELLYVADQNSIIEIQLYHFSQALKQYRNFIHPAVEIRKGKIKKITKEDAEIAWKITKKIIYEI